MNDNLSGLRGIQKQLPDKYRVLFSDASGNHERLTYLYNSTKVALLEKVGEIGIPVSDQRHIKMPDIKTKFAGFDRNPFIAAFRAGSLSFVLINAHLYYGKAGTNQTKTSKASIERRCLEAYAIGRWADLRRRNANAYSQNIMALGDFNLPKAEQGDPVYRALTKRGLTLPTHSNQIGSSLDDDKQYDQILFAPGELETHFTDTPHVFDFDGGVFKTLWDTRSETDFRAYVRYYLSDHRLLWIPLSL